jgi:hypothetical protein
LWPTSPALAGCIRHPDGHIVTCPIAGSRDWPSAPGQPPFPRPSSNRVDVKPECGGLSGTELVRCYVEPPSPQPHPDPEEAGAVPKQSRP